MIKHILVPATGTIIDDGVFSTALAVGRPGNAHLQFLHTRIDVVEVMVGMSSDGMVGGAAVQGLIDQLEVEAKTLETRARGAVAAFCDRSGITLDGATPGQPGLSAEFSVETGSPGRLIAEYGRFADIIVASRRTEDGPGTDVLEDALMGSGRPVLIAPAAPPQAWPDVVAIAWKDTAEAARAVTAAMPFLEAAKHVVILTVEEAGAAPEESCERLRRSLRWHNPATDLRHCGHDGRPPAEVLLDAAVAEGAGLLVMGGYSHSRLREMVLGGFTRHVLEQAGLPVLMAH